MAETEQQFTLHAQSRNIARIIGYPAGLGLLVVAVFFPFGDTEEAWVGRVLCALFGLGTLVWTWSMDRRRRVEVTEQQVTVVNSFSRYVVAWHELSDIEFEEIKAEGGWTAYHRLAFVTPSRRIVAEAPAGSEPELMKVRDRILHARKLSRNEPQSDSTQPLPQPQPQPMPPQGMRQLWPQPPWPQQGMPPGGQQPPDGPAPVQRQPQKAKRFGWPTVIITAVISLFVGMLFAFGGEPTPTAVPEATATVTETENLTAEESSEPKPKEQDQPEVADTISDGIYEVGVDVKAGQYKTNVPEGAICYWDRSRDDKGDYELKEGPARLSVTIKKGESFETEDCGTWKRV
jgi:hypothetical protein